MSRLRAPTSRAGFTLIETIVAVMLFMIIIGAVYGAFRAANMTVTRTEERADMYQTARILLAQMTAELCSAYQPSEATESSLVGEDTPGDGSGPQFDKISVLTTARSSVSMVEPAGDLCRVTYTAESTPLGEPLGLYMDEDFRPGLSVEEREPQPRRLSSLVVGLDCKYLDGATGEWADEWKEREKLPKAVRMEMLLKPERKGAKPMLVASTANLAISLGPAPVEAPEEDPGEE